MYLKAACSTEVVLPQRTLLCHTTVDGICFGSVGMQYMWKSEDVFGECRVESEFEGTCTVHGCKAIYVECRVVSEFDGTCTVHGCKAIYVECRVVSEFDGTCTVHGCKAIYVECRVVSEFDGTCTVHGCKAIYVECRVVSEFEGTCMYCTWVQGHFSRVSVANKDCPTSQMTSLP